MLDTENPFTYVAGDAYGNVFFLEFLINISYFFAFF